MIVQESNETQSNVEEARTAFLADMQCQVNRAFENGAEVTFIPERADSLEADFRKLVT